MSAKFDPFEYIRQLEAVGVPRIQAYVHARALQKVAECRESSSYLSVRSHALGLLLDETDAQLLEEISRLRHEIAQSGPGTNAKITESETRLNEKILSMLADLRRLRSA